jgi:hypothetical protein
MEPYQVYVAVYLALFLITRFFPGNDNGDIESENETILDDLDILSTALGTLVQLED